MSPALLWGAGAGFVALVVLIAVSLWRRARRGAPETRAERSPSRRDVMIEIAELDLKREAGEIDEGEWEQRRSSMKELLEKERHPEPLP